MIALIIMHCCSMWRVCLVIPVLWKRCVLVDWKMWLQQGHCLDLSRSGILKPAKVCRLLTYLLTALSPAVLFCSRTIVFVLDHMSLTTSVFLRSARLRIISTLTCRLLFSDYRRTVANCDTNFKIYKTFLSCQTDYQVMRSSDIVTQQLQLQFEVWDFQSLSSDWQ